MMPTPRGIVSALFSRAGIEIGGSRPWDIQVENPRFYRRVLRGSIGLGDSFLDGDWTVAELDAFFRRIIGEDLAGSLVARVGRALLEIRARLTNMQTRRRSLAVAERHYDLDHRLYEKILGPWNQYTCCFFDGTDDLEQAEVNKLEMICNKLELAPGDRVLDIGCGWGGFARYAASTRGCRVTGISLSEEQIEYARRYTRGLPVEILKCDYRDLPEVRPPGSFNKVLVCGMVEHVGYRNYRRLMQVVHRMLAPGGLYLLHTIGNTSSSKTADPWLQRYIFANSMLPSMEQLCRACSGLFVVQDWENYGRYYAQTLAAWQRNFEANWHRIRQIAGRTSFDERFRRMFNYYFLSCKAAFEVESILLWQVVMCRPGERDGVYPRVNLRTPEPAFPAATRGSHQAAGQPPSPAAPAAAVS
jgi:cyclopropane-fatty-acyl-phospholipid synthase